MICLVVTKRVLLFIAISIFFSPTKFSLGFFLTARGRQSLTLPQKMTTSLQSEVREGPIWDPVAQIYVGGIIPENAQVTQLVEENNGFLRLFGYGSLCWNRGTGALAHPSVKHTLGRARGYRRCWAQKSTDHRGNPSFPGIVCTLLKDDEFRRFRAPSSNEESLTEGLVYVVPPELVDECLSELDFREKGVSSSCNRLHSMLDAQLMDIIYVAGLCPRCDYSRRR